MDFPLPTNEQNFMQPLLQQDLSSQSNAHSNAPPNMHQHQQPGFQQQNSKQTDSNNLSSAAGANTPSSTSGVPLTDQLIESLQPALVFKNFTKEINSVDISHDGKYLVAGSEDFSVSLYDLERGDKVNTYYSKRYGVDLVKFTHHNKCILVASKRDNNYRILYWSLHDNVILCSFIGHTDSIVSIDLNPADSTFVSQAKDETTRVWEYERKQCKIRLNQSKASCFDNTGMILACLFRKKVDDLNNNKNKDDERPGFGADTANQSANGGSNKIVQQVHLFNTENYEERPFSIFSMEDTDLQIAEIRTVKFSPDGQYIMLGTTENLICLIDAFEGKMKHKLRGPIYNTNSPDIMHQVGQNNQNPTQNSSLNNSDANLTFEANFSPDSKYVITGSEGKQKILCWQIESEKQIPMADFHPTTVLAVKFNHTYCMLVSACQNLVVWIPDPNYQPLAANNSTNSVSQQQQNMMQQQQPNNMNQGLGQQHQISGMHQQHQQQHQQQQSYQNQNVNGMNNRAGQSFQNGSAAAGNNNINMQMGLGMNMMGQAPPATNGMNGAAVAAQQQSMMGQAMNTHPYSNMPANNNTQNNQPY